MTPRSSRSMRTRLAHDRTLMAWVRTSTSLISWVPTIYLLGVFGLLSVGLRH